LGFSCFSYFSFQKKRYFLTIAYGIADAGSSILGRLGKRPLFPTVTPMRTNPVSSLLPNTTRRGGSRIRSREGSRFRISCRYSFPDRRAFVDCALRNLASSACFLIPFPVHSYREDEPQTVQVVRQGEVDKGRDELGMESSVNDWKKE
jgi:hypothetical protein